MGRPSALGKSFQIKSLEDCDLVLAELSWLRDQGDTLAARLSQKIAALTTETNASAVVEIDGDRVRMADRVEVLELAIEKWLAKNIAGKLPDGAKSIDLPHGRVGLRQTVLSVSVPKSVKDDVILTAIDGLALGLVRKLLSFVQRFVKSLGVSLSDLITVKTSVNTSGIKKAISNKHITAETVRGLGLEVVEPFDAVTYSVNKYVAQ